MVLQPLTLFEVSRDWATWATGKNSASIFGRTWTRKPAGSEFGTQGNRYQTYGCGQLSFGEATSHRTVKFAVTRRRGKVATGLNREGISSESIMKGRKPKQESRAMEFRRELLAWKQIPEASRPSLRSLACDLGTSHQLLSFYLKNLYKWESKECWRQAREVRARANAEGRSLTQWGEQQVYAYNRAGVRATFGPMLLDAIKRLRKESERGPLCRQDIKALKIFARRFPEAQELLQKCLRDGIKKRKRFVEIVKETPRQEGETYTLWVRRIWNECGKYDTKCPTVITVELLQKYSQDGVKNQKNNLPAIPSRPAKSFGCDSA